MIYFFIDSLIAASLTLNFKKKQVFKDIEMTGITISGTKYTLSVI